MGESLHVSVFGKRTFSPLWFEWNVCEKLQIEVFCVYCQSQSGTRNKMHAFSSPNMRPWDVRDRSHELTNFISFSHGISFSFSSLPSSPSMPSSNTQSSHRNWLSHYHTVPRFFFIEFLFDRFSCKSFSLFTIFAWFWLRLLFLESKEKRFFL